MIPGDANLKIWFMEGGCMKFLRSFRMAISKIRENHNAGPNQAFMDHVQSSAF